MALRILTLVALVQCVVGKDPIEVAENLTSAGVNCPTKNIGKFKVSQINACIDIALNGASIPFNGARVQVWNCNNGRNQDFIWCADGSIVSALDANQCLTVPGGDPYASSSMQMWQCNGGWAQKWNYNSNQMAIYNAYAGHQYSDKKMCLDTAAGSTKDGTDVVSYHAQGGCTPWYTFKLARPDAGNSNATDRVDTVLV